MIVDLFSEVNPKINTHFLLFNKLWTSFWCVNIQKWWVKTKFTYWSLHTVCCLYSLRPKGVKKRKADLGEHGKLAWVSLSHVTGFFELLLSVRENRNLIQNINTEIPELQQKSLLDSNRKATNKEFYETCSQPQPKNSERTQKISSITNNR